MLLILALLKSVQNMTYTFGKQKLYKVGFIPEVRCTRVFSLI